MFVIATDFRLKRLQQEVFAASKFYKILERYCNAFGKAVICSRVVEVESVTDDDVLIDDDMASSLEAPAVEKVILGHLDSQLRASLNEAALVVVRLPSVIGYRCADIAFELKKPVLAEAMACAWDGYWNHSLYGKVAAPYMFFKMRRIMRNADYGLYVTRKFLQNRYPRKGKQCSVSNVDISTADSIPLSRVARRIKETDFTKPVFMTLGGIDVRAKGQRYVIEAMRKLNSMGIRATYYIVGGGSDSQLVKLAKQNGVLEQVLFTGNVSRNKVFELLEKCDVYIQPSLQEGLPRSVIEAMSCGCLCLGSRTGGTPELLSPECVFDRKSSNAIVEAFVCLSSLGTESLINLVEKNLRTAEEYDGAILERRRNAFFETINKEIALEH